MTARATASKAAEERERAIDALLSLSSIRTNTKSTAGKINAACQMLDAEGAALSIKNVVRKLAQMFADDCPAESSIRNATSSGKVYRAIIEAWRTYQIAKRPVPKHVAEEPVEADLSDALLLSIQPEGARTMVLLMRTALRNTRRQFQLLQSVSVDRLVITGPGSSAPGPEAPKLDLQTADADVLKAFLDEKLCSARGVTWNKRGQLTDADGNKLSGPGLQDALLRVIEMRGHGRGR